jgi:hypothetical protein
MGPRNANCKHNPTCFLLPTPHMYVQKEELLKLAINIGLFCAASLLKVSLYQMKITREECTPENCDVLSVFPSYKTRGYSFFSGPFIQSSQITVHKCVGII